VNTDQARHATDLLKALKRAFRDSAQTELSIDGDGVHWQCVAIRGGRACRVDCFYAKGPEYLVSFRESGRQSALAYGRTDSRELVLSSIADWLDGQSLEDLYARHAFVDVQKRSLTSLAADLVRRFPELGRTASHELHHRVCDLYELSFTAADRSCQLDYWGKEMLPQVSFTSDQCPMFLLHTSEAAQLGAILKRWLCDRAMPSALGAEFPAAIELLPFAAHYEQGRPVEGEFLESWNAIERFYLSFERWPAAQSQVLPFISQLRRKGYDKVLRAGQSMTTLVLSRSRRHGLRHGQPRVAIEFGADGRMALRSSEAQRLVLDQIIFTAEVDAILKQLAGEPVD
jgi:hypothetical protein